MKPKQFLSLQWKSTIEVCTGLIFHFPLKISFIPLSCLKSHMQRSTWMFQYDSLSLRCRRLFLPSSHTRDASDLVAAGKSKALSIAVIYNPKSVSIFLFRYLYFEIVPWVIYFSRFPHTPQYQKFKTCSVSGPVGMQTSSLGSQTFCSGVPPGAFNILLSTPT